MLKIKEKTGQTQTLTLSQSPDSSNMNTGNIQKQLREGEKSSLFAKGKEYVLNHQQTLRGSPSSLKNAPLGNSVQQTYEENIELKQQMQKLLSQLSQQSEMGNQELLEQFYKYTIKLEHQLETCYQAIGQATRELQATRENANALEKESDAQVEELNRSKKIIEKFEEKFKENRSEIEIVKQDHLKLRETLHQYKFN